MVDWKANLDLSDGNMDNCILQLRKAEAERKKKICSNYKAIK